jgi:hypothetical protein
MLPSAISITLVTAIARLLPADCTMPVAWMEPKIVVSVMAASRHSVGFWYGLVYKLVTTAFKYLV